MTQQLRSKKHDEAGLSEQLPTDALLNIKYGDQTMSRLQRDLPVPTNKPKVILENLSGDMWMVFKMLCYL